MRCPTYLIERLNTRADENVMQPEILFFAGKNAKWHNHFGK